VTIKRCRLHLAQAGVESLRKGKALDGEPSWPNCLQNLMCQNPALTRYVLSPEAKEDLGDNRGYFVSQGGAKT
jgi:hypothetical protein